MVTERINIILIISMCLTGLYIGSYFKKRFTVTIHGPSSEEVRKKVFEYQGKKYRFKPYLCISPGHWIDIFKR